MSICIRSEKSYTSIADNAFKNNEYSEAISLYKKAYSKLKGNDKAEKGRIIFQIAESYRLTNNPSDAAKWYDRAIGRYTDNILYFKYAEMLKQIQKYDDAIVQYKTYQEKVPNDPRGKIGQESCELSKKWKDNPTRYKVASMKVFNSKQMDFSPFFADQKKFTIIAFTSGRESSFGKKTDSWTGESCGDGGAAAS